MKLEKLILKNFLTFSDLEYVFEDKAYLVQGINRTNDGQKSNGSGKSSLLAGIEFATTFTNSKGVLDAELISHGENQANVQLFIKCDVRKETLWIDVLINLTKSNTLKLKTQKYDSEEWVDVPFSNVANGKQFVSDWIGISSTDLFNYFLVSNARFKSFFKASNTEKVALINRFSDARIIDGIEDIDTAELEEKRDSQKQLVSSTSGKIELLEESLEKELNRDFETELAEEREKFLQEIEDVKSEIQNCEEKIEDLDNDKLLVNGEITGVKVESASHSVKVKEVEKIIKGVLKEVQSAQDRVQDCNDSVENFEVIDFDTEKEVFEESIEKSEGEIEKLSLDRQKKEKLKKQVLEVLEDVSVKLSGVITCPSCSHKFLLDGNLKELQTKEKKAKALQKDVLSEISKVDELIQSTKGSISELELSISKINKRQSDWNEEKAKLTDSYNKAVSVLNQLNSSLEKEKAKLGSLELEAKKRVLRIESLEQDLKIIDDEIGAERKKIDLKKSSIKLIEQSIANLHKSDNKEQIKEIRSQIKEFKKLHTSHQVLLNKIEDDLYSKNQWRQQMKQFKLFLANQSLEVIQYNINRYLKEIGSDLEVKIEGFKVKADNTVKEEIDVKIIRDAKERTFSSFSGGERGRLIFASMLTMQYIINQNHPHGGLDLLIADEIFDSLDELGLISIFEIAKPLGVTTLIVSHITFERDDDDIITIIKENGISRIR